MGYEVRLLVGVARDTYDKRTHFDIYATIELHKVGFSSALHKINSENTKNNDVYWYHGSEERTQDYYGKRPQPVPISRVLSALEADLKIEEYDRFKWALSLLKSMDNSLEPISALILGH